VHVSVARKRGEWVIQVSDNGIGIDPAYLDEIFKPFKRLHGQEYPGSGIGLAACRKIVAGYGGRIWVDSKIGEGSKFSFTFPAAAKAQPA
jgi:signal transduction histidine kinase